MKKIRLFIQHIIITLQMYFQNGIANHAAACAYAFLLSMAPTLLLLAFFIFLFFHSSPSTISLIISRIPIISGVFDEQWLASELFSVSRPVIPTVIFIISIIWAGRILALSMQRGLGIIFPTEKKRNPIKNTLVTLAIEGSLVILIIVVIVSSRTVLRFFKTFDFLPQNSIVQYITSLTGGQILNVSLLGFATYLSYIFVPVESPKKTSAFMGAVLCGICVFGLSFGLDFIIDKGRYNFLYGTFGNIIIVLVNVYFFFMFYFLGAQFAYVRDSFTELPPSIIDVAFQKDSAINKKIKRILTQRKGTVNNEQ